MPVTLSPYALTSLETVKEHLGVPPATLTYDDLLKRLINASSARVEAHCDRFLKRRTGIVDYHDGIAGNRLLLNQWPAEIPTELWIDPTGEFTDVDYKLASGDYYLETSAKGEGVGIVLAGGRSFPNGIRNIKILYDAGYATVPSDLEDACIWFVEYLYNMRNDRTVGLETKGKNQENTTYRGDIPPIVKEHLELYRRLEWGSAFRAVITR
jgi:hypothetical protein